MPTHTPTRTNWFETFFHGVANEMWRRAATAEQTSTEASYIEKTLGKRSRLLDVPCGNGRISLELARRGCRVTGIDISQEFIADAQAASQRAKNRPTYQVGDMRRLPWKASFDGAFCFGNAFGYFDHADMLRFVRGVARALRPGGRFLVQTFMAAESILPKLPGREWWPLGDIHFAVENRYHAAESCLESQCTFLQNGTMEKSTFWHHVYTAAEIGRLMAQAGLRVTRMSKSYEDQPFAVGEQMLLVLAEKAR